MATAADPTAARLASVNGIELAYQTFGTGRADAPPLVLIHGGFGSVEMFGSNVAALAVKRQVIGGRERLPRRADPGLTPGVS